MLLEKILIEKKILKINLKKYYFFLFFSTFLFFLSLYFIFLLTEKMGITFKIFDSKNITTKQKIQIYLWMVLFLSIAFNLIWFIDSLAMIFINKYYRFNIYRCSKWLKLKLFFTFRYKLFTQLCKRVNDFKEEEIDFVKYMQKNRFLLQGSKSILWKYKDFERQTNDFDFNAFEINAKLNDLEKQKNIEIKQKDNIVGKLIFNGVSVEVIISKYVPSYFVENKRGIKIPKITWMIAMKFHQLVKLYNLRKDGNIVSKEKINNTLIDTAFLLSKLKIFNINKIILNIQYLYISNFFIGYFLNSNCFDDFSDGNITKFSEYLATEINDLKNVNELFFFFDELISKLKSNTLMIKMAKSINQIIKDKEKLENNFLNYSSSEEREISSLKRIFSSEAEKNKFIKDNYQDYSFGSKVIKLFYDLFENDPNKQLDTLDIRQIMLLELNKKLI
ncbi:MAG4530 family protein [Metamycoplasma hyosynoviae]|uniref:MAG4530 family protein n=1 Tax=Metamycoplasma hyosynoviae TaxID=29559 RepID=UPI003B67354B